MQYILFNPERKLPPYTLYLVWESGGEYVIPNLAFEGRRLELPFEIERAKRHHMANQPHERWFPPLPARWCEVRERETGKTVFSTKVEPNTVESRA